MGLIVKHIPHTVDLNRPVKKTYIDTLLATEDNLAHRFDITLKRGGEAVTLPDGTAVIAYFIRYSDNATVPINNGSISGNVASITLTNACYSKPGQFAIIIKVSVDNIINTIFYGEGTIFASSTEKVVDEENVIPSLSDLLAQIEAMEAATNAAKAVAQDMLIVREDPATNKADKTRTEITDAAAAGKACFAIYGGKVYSYVGLEPDKKNNNVGYVPTFRNSPDYDDVNYKLSWYELQIENNGEMHLWGNTNVRTPTPKSIKFTGAVKATYDGSAEVTVNIPEGGGGNGGGLPTGGDPNMMLVTDADGNAEWQERTHYSETKEVVVLPDGTYEIDLDEGCAIIHEFTTEPVDSGQYTVTYNGTAYQAEGKSFDMEGISGVYVGNFSEMGGDDTGEPFLLIVFSEASVELVGVSGWLYMLDGSESCTCKIEGVAEVVVKIPDKYLPDGRNSNIRNGFNAGSLRTYAAAEEDDEYTMGSAAFAEGAFTKASGEASHAEGAYTVASGQYSHAEGEGTVAAGWSEHVQGKYNIESATFAYAHVVGNGESDTERSNAHTLDWDGNAWYAGTVEGTALILKSSTSGSTKRFKITVDDSGAIKATAL